MNPHPRQRVHPPVAIQGSFGPYDRKELEAARAQLIRDVYKSNAGGIMARVKLKCGITSNPNGSFTGCEPHWITNVSYESQSCSLMMEDSFPWMREATPPKAEDGEHALNGNMPQEMPTNTSEMTSQTINKQDTSKTCAKSSRHEDIDMISPSSSSNTNTNNNRRRSPETVDDMFERPSKMRKLDRGEDKFEGNQAAYVLDTNTTRPSTSMSTSRSSPDLNMNTERQGDNIKDTTEKDTNKIKLQKHEEEEEGIIISSDDEDECTVFREQTLSCYKCDLCDLVTINSDDIKKHLQNKHHYSASRYIGTRKGDTVVPKYLEKCMDYTCKSAEFKSLLPICPKCYAGFQNIHSCAAHSLQVHGSEKPVYSVGKIRECKTTAIYRMPECHVCNTHFDKISRLNSHMKQQKHYTHRNPGSSEVVVFVCSYCSKQPIYAGNQSHQYVEHLRAMHGNHNKPIMKIIYVEKPKEVKEILPKISRHEEHKKRRHYVHKSKKKSKVKVSGYLRRKIKAFDERYKWTKDQNHDSGISKFPSRR